MSRFHCNRALTTGMAALALSALAAAPATVRPVAADGAFRPYVEGEVIVTYRATAAPASAARVASRVRATGVQSFGRQGLQRLRLGRGVSTAAAMAALSQDPSVAAVQPNFIYQGAASPNDSYFTNGSLWGLNNPSAPNCDVDAAQAWDLSTGSSEVVVAVIDSGIDYNHPDLVDNVWTNDREISGNGIDDDGNGWVDDLHGMDAYNGDGNPTDDHGHGTHVSGTIGGRGNNGAGVAGVNWNVKIIACKFLGYDLRGTTAHALTCLQYVHGLKQRGVNVVATNNSWGGGSFDPALKAAIDESNSRGILFVAAAGNGNAFGTPVNNDVTPFYPSSYDSSNIIAVTATDSSDLKWSKANYGAATVDIGAPGVGVWSTVPGGSYQSWNGTSMAAPHVTGTVALLKALKPTFSVAQVKDVILGGANACAALAGKTTTGGRLNIYNALTRVPAGTPPPAPVPTVPAAPTSLTAAAASSSQVNLAWSDTSSDETGFVVQRSTNGVDFAQIATAAANSTSYSSSGLLASTGYTFRVCATNGAGNSANSNIASATTLAPPAPAPAPVASAPTAPSGLVAIAVSRSQINLSWNNTSTNQTWVYIQRSRDGVNWSDAAMMGGTATSFADAGLQKQTLYYYRVRSANSVGSSPYSNTVNARTANR